MASPAAVLNILVRANTASAVLGLRQVSTAAETAARSSDTAAKKHKAGAEVIGKAARVGALAVAGLGAASVYAAGNFEKSLNIFQAVAGATEKEMGKVSKAAKQLGADVKLPGTSAADAAEAMTELAKGGLSVRDSMNAARGVLQLAAAAEIGNAEAATIAARALNAFGLEGKQAGKVSDLLAAAANATTAEITDVAMALQQASASAHQLGVPIEDLTAEIGLLANAGISGSDAGTSLKTMMARLNPVTDKAKAAVKALGVDVFDANGKFTGTRDAIAQYSKALGRLNPEQRQAAIQTIFGSDAQRAANIVLAGGVKAFDKMKTAVTQQGAAQAMANAKTKGFKGSLDAFMSTLETLAITFGEVLLPAATSTMRFLSKAFGGLGAHRTAVLAVTAVIGGLSVAIWAVNAATKAWAATTAAFTVIQAAFNTVLALNPIVLVAIALAALVVALIVAYKECETFRKIVDKVWATLKVVAAWLVAAFVAAFRASAKAVKDAWTTIRNTTRTLWDWFGPYLKGVFTVLKTIASLYFLAYKTIITTTWTVIRTATKVIWEAIKLILTTAWTVLKTVAGVYFDGIKLAILTPIRAARDVLATIWGVIKTVAVNAWGGIRKAIKGAADPILDVILAPFKSAVKGVAKFAKLILQVVGKIPGVDTGGPIKAIDGFVKGLAKGGKFQAFANGGAFARTGGVVDRPITLMGEEAPRHPEFVIPTNPAYRKRARNLVAQAAGAVGLYDGGVVSTALGVIKSLRADPKSSLALMEAGIVESGMRNLPYGDADSRGFLQIRDSTAAGMGINNMSVAQSAAAFLTRGFWGKGSAMALASGNPTASAGWVAQQTQGSAFPDRYDQVVSQAAELLKGKASGIDLGDIAGALGSAASFLAPRKLIGKLPSPGDLLPDWLGGMGKWVIDQVKDYITSAVSGIVGGGAGIGGQTSGTWKMARKIAEKFALQITSSYRTKEQNAAAGGVENSLHTHGSVSNPGAFDMVGPLASMNAALNWVKQNLNLLEAMVHDVGSGLHLHLGFFKKGGLFGGVPFVGSYANGGVVPRDGMAMVHRGETITPVAGSSSVTIIVDPAMAWLKDFIRVESNDGQAVGLSFSTPGIPGRNATY